ncbi:amidohydrolase family protein [Rhodococcus sp. G-MC3]|uniref:amidohydrolase family protein n=1 Tax=Rhodococcus sp. G-MC3 TaxID=3046209 RepID=UPI0024BB0A2D|nr:amidohydrolase family protein [Rhodococcus sp. G-MC3]MDJ0396407.1 amidohydrolase family protein [Rhodococcus sp. G-MC3]
MCTESPTREPVARAALTDVHAHFVTDHYVRAASHAGHAHPDGMPAWPTWNAEEHLALMDSANITRSILSISSPGVHFGDNATARALAREVNDYAAELTTAQPNRFGQFAALPLPDVDGAIIEATYALDELGADGVTFLSNAHGMYLGNPRLEPLLAELDRRHATVFVHPTSPPNWEAVALGRPRPLMEFLFDTARTVTGLVLSDHLDRFPTINWIFTHGGGVIPLLADRIELFQTAFAGGQPGDIATLLSRLAYDSAGTPFPIQLPTLAHIVGTNRILYGSDYCFTPPAAVKAQIAAIDMAPAPSDEGTWRQVMADNSERLLPSHVYRGLG